MRLLFVCPICKKRINIGILGKIIIVGCNDCLISERGYPSSKFVMQIFKAGYRLNFDEDTVKVQELQEA